MEWMSQYKAGVEEQAKGVAVVDPAFAKKYPRLFECMSTSVWPDGQPRTPSSLLFFAEEGAFKVCLSERDLGLTLWGGGETFTVALETLEKRLNAPNIEWRRAKPQEGRKRKS